MSGSSSELCNLHYLVELMGYGVPPLSLPPGALPARAPLPAAAAPPPAAAPATGAAQLATRSVPKDSEPGRRKGLLEMGGSDTERLDLALDFDFWMHGKTSDALLTL